MHVLLTFTVLGLSARHLLNLRVGHHYYDRLITRTFWAESPFMVTRRTHNLYHDRDRFYPLGFPKRVSVILPTLSNILSMLKYEVFYNIEARDHIQVIRTVYTGSTAFKNITFNQTQTADHPATCSRGTDQFYTRKFEANSLRPNSFLYMSKFSILKFIIIKCFPL